MTRRPLPPKSEEFEMPRGTDHRLYDDRTADSLRLADGRVLRIEELIPPTDGDVLRIAVRNPDVPGDRFLTFEPPNDTIDLNAKIESIVGNDGVQLAEGSGLVCKDGTFILYSGDPSDTTDYIVIDSDGILVKETADKWARLGYDSANDWFGLHIQGGMFSLQTDDESTLIDDDGIRIYSGVNKVVHLGKFDTGKYGLWCDENADTEISGAVISGGSLDIEDSDGDHVTVGPYTIGLGIHDDSTNGGRIAADTDGLVIMPTDDLVVLMAPLGSSHLFRIDVLDSNGAGGQFPVAHVAVTASGSGVFAMNGTMFLDPSDTLPQTTSNEMLVLGRNDNYATIKANTGDHMIIDSDAAYLSLNHYENDDVVLAYGGGNVGVGNNSPTYKMDVSGTIRATGTGYFEGKVYFQGLSSNAGIWLRNVTATTKYGRIWVENGNLYYSYDGGTSTQLN